MWLGILVLLPLSTLVVNTLAIGFEEMPYRVISDGAPTGETVYLRAGDTDDKTIAPADADLSAETVAAVASTRRAVYHTSGAVVAITGAHAAEIAERLASKLPAIRFEASADRTVEGQVEEIIDLLVERHVLPDPAADGFII